MSNCFDGLTISPDKIFPELPKKDLNAILDELIQFSNEESIKSDKIVYPSDVPFPLMKNTIPVTGFRWANFYKQFLNYLTSLIRTSNHKK